MSEIRNIPDVKDASGFFKFDGAKKAIIVPLSAVEGLEKGLGRLRQRDWRCNTPIQQVRDEYR